MEDVNILLNKGVELGHFPGASYAIVYANGHIDYDVVGYRQLFPKKVKNNGSEIYDCASLTKVISTTTMIMKLIEEGKLSLDTKVSSVLPQFKHQDISVYHLLTHSSGLPADIKRAKALVNRTDVLEKIFSYDLINHTGMNIVYSDIGYILLGLMIETITQKTLNEYAKEVVFDPLGMDDTSYQPDKNRCAPTEYRDDDVYQGWLQGLVHDEKSFAMGGLAGHAGMFSTTKDIAKFILSILNNDGKVLQKKSVNSLFPVQISDERSDGTVLVRSLGWNKPTPKGTAGDMVDFDNTILHTGFTGCNVWIERSKGVGFVMLSNAVHPKREGNRIIQYRNTIGNLILSPKGE